MPPAAKLFLFVAGGTISFNSGKGHSAHWRGGTEIFRSPERPTFANTGKSGQKRRSNLRFENPPTPRTLRLAVLRPSRTRQSVNHPKCGIDLLLSPLPLKMQNAELRTGAFQRKNGQEPVDAPTHFFVQFQCRRGSSRILQHSRVSEC